MSCTDLFQIDATIVANEFIDKYMPGANGDYVKVYLYLLKNGAQGTDIATVAEVLSLTEGDVSRAIKYWENQGILSVGSCEESAIQKEALISDAKNQKEAAEFASVRTERIRKYSEEIRNTKTDTDRAEVKPLTLVPADEKKAEEERAQEELRNHYRRTEGKAILNRLSEDAEFAQLLLIVQKYRSKLLTEAEEQVLAYLYDGLHLSCELLDYLVAYCVESGHNNMRYIEKTGLNWANIGIRDVNAARRRTREFDQIANEKKTKASAKSAKQGITRSADLDDWVKAQVLEKI